MVHWSRMAHDWFHTKMAKWGVPGYGSVHPGIPWFWGVTSCPFLVPMVARSSLPSKRSYCRRASRNSLGGFFLEHDQQTTRKSWWIYSFWGLTWGILILNDTDIYIYILICVYIYILCIESEEDGIIVQLPCASFDRYWRGSMFPQSLSQKVYPYHPDIDTAVSKSNMLQSK